ncbi:histone-fold-containing protein [Mycena galopus ATCC 62051]|nr:histone-fold-containing protein [Mycena galopus ATCC 62051]
MPGKGKGAKTFYPGAGKGEGRGGGGRVTSSEKAGLQFPVARIRRFLKQHHEKRVTVPSAGKQPALSQPSNTQYPPVYLAAVLEYLMAELLELAGNCAREVGRKIIIPRHILLAIKNDDELDRLLKKVIINEGGVRPHIHPQLIPEAKAKGKKTASQEA